MAALKKRKGALGGPIAVFVEVVLGLVVLGALLVFGPVLLGNALVTGASVMGYSPSVGVSVNTTGLAMINLISNIPNYLSLIIMAIVFGVAIWAVIAYVGRTGEDRV